MERPQAEREDGSSRTGRSARLRLVGGIAVLSLFLAGAAATALQVGMGVGVPAVSDALVGDAPDLEAASERPAARTTVVRALDGSVIGTFRPAELHEPVRPADLPRAVRAR